MGRYFVMFFTLRENLGYYISFVIKGIAIFYYSFAFDSLDMQHPRLLQHWGRRCPEGRFETLDRVYDERFAKQYGFRPYVRQVIHRYAWPRPDTVFQLLRPFPKQ